MSKTISFHVSRHAASRVQQRGFRDDDIGFVVENGTQVPDGYILLKKDADRIAEQATRLRGAFVPLQGACAVSIYRPRTSKRKYLLRQDDSRGSNEKRAWR